jgi:tetratricopeptide (TPR) repeat protein
VLEHNRIDLVSLAAVTARALALVEHGSQACRDGWERLALGRLLVARGDAERATRCFEDAASDPQRDVRIEALARIACRHRRERRHADAAAAWQQVFNLTHEDDWGNARAQGLARDAAEALAVHHEHRGRNLEAARELARTALGLERSRRGVEALQYRLERLERKMSVQQKSGDDAAPLLD